MNPAELTEHLLDRLRGIPALEGVPAGQVAALAERMTSRRLSPGEILAVEGTSGNALFVLLQGEVQVSRRTLDGDAYTVATLDGQNIPSFGEFALLADARHEASIEALGECGVLALGRADFERFGEEHPEAGLRITRNLARRMSAELGKVRADAALLFETLVNEVRSKTAK
jgi:CRP-like cAMP-binding protein